jgi:hypothetical protein
MKKQLLLLSFLITTTGIFAQSPIEKGESQINAGFGFSNWGLPVYVGFDYGFLDDITLGGEVSFRTYRDDYYIPFTTTTTYRHTVIGIAANGNYHFNRLLNLPSEWDLYAGVDVGFYIYNSPKGYPGSNLTGIGAGPHAGGRYFINEKIGFNAELGGNNAFSGGKIGVTIKL